MRLDFGHFKKYPKTAVIANEVKQPSTVFLRSIVLDCFAKARNDGFLYSIIKMAKVEMRCFFSLCIILCFITSSTLAASPALSLRDKIGQMLLIGFAGKKINAESPIVKSIEENNIGGVILFDYDYQTGSYDKNIENPAQVKQLNSALQYFNRRANLKYHRPILPLLISVDYEGGAVSRLAERYGFPKTVSATEFGKKKFLTAELIAKSMANTLHEAGFNLNFAPVLDIDANSDNPIIKKKERSFSQNPQVVARYARIYSHAFLRKKIQCVFKHFPGHGSSTKDSHVDFVDVTSTWQLFELEPYQQLLNSNDSCGAVMSAHIVNRQLDDSGLPATLSHTMLTKILRTQLRFKGVIITDDMQMKAISDHYGLEKALVLAINAGADMLIFGNNLSVTPQDPKQLIDIIEAKVLSGDITLERINDAYQHIRVLKQSVERH